MERFKRVASRQIGKVPLLHHLLWKAKSKLPNASIQVVSVEEATACTLQWLKTLPNHYDCIIGIPRSGLWIASLIALKFGKPLSTPSAFVRGELWHSLHVEKPKVKRVLLIEDDVIYGKQILKAKQMLLGFDPALKVETASLFATSKGRKLVDYCFQMHNPPLLYEWTLLTNMASLGKLAVDLDGVLCHDDGETPYLIPQYPIEAVITSRLEKDRSATEAWLKQHGVRYNRLVMLDLPSEKERTLEAIIQHKVGALRTIRPFWFWESNPVEAEAIRSRAHLPVLCVGNMVLLL